MISYWEKVFYKSDIAIVGGGISGLSLANALIEKSPKLKITILEKDVIPASASTRNAGFACFGSFTELIADKEKMGKDQMLNLVEKRWKGLHLLRSRLGDKAIQYENFGGFEILEEHQLNLLDHLDEINKDLKAIFNDSVYSLRNNQISEFQFNTNWCKALLHNPFEGQLHSGLMLKGLRDLALSKGVQIYSGTEVIDYDELSNDVILHTENGNVFNAGKVIFCNNAYSKKLFPEEDVKPGRGLVMMTEEMQIPFSGTFHIEEGFYYFRNVGRRFLIGGGRNKDFENEETFEKGINQKIKNSILEKTTLILNGKSFKEDMWWSGIMGFGESKTPILKNVSSNIKMGVRLSGMGVALASQMAEEISIDLLNEL